MSDDYKKGLIIGLSMNPLCVIKDNSKETSDNYCGAFALSGVLSNECYCENIELQEE